MPSDSLMKYHPVWDKLSLRQYIGDASLDAWQALVTLADPAVLPVPRPLKFDGIFFVDEDSLRRAHQKKHRNCACQHPS